jgi:hypothetical protein
MIASTEGKAMSEVLRTVRCLIAGSLVLTSAGCLYLPLPLIEVLPQQPLRSVEVLDSTTLKPIAHAKVTGVVLPYSHGFAFPSDSVPYSDETPDTIGQEDGGPIASFAYPSQSHDRFTCRPGCYLGYETILMFWIIMGYNRHGHFVCLIVDAPGHQSAIIGIDQLSPPSFVRHDCISTRPFRYASKEYSTPWSGAALRADGTLSIRLKSLNEKNGAVWRTQDSQGPEQADRD